MFVRVRDNDTGHEYDVDESSPRIGDTVTALDGYPKSRQARPSKFRVDLADVLPVSATVADLDEFAAEHDIDLSDAANKTDKRSAIEAALTNEPAAPAPQGE